LPGLSFLCDTGGDKLKALAVDIEVDVGPEGFFPRSELNPIICIGYQEREDKDWGPKRILMAETHDNDGEILEEFVSAIEADDPDIITGFNLAAFDLPYIIDRLRANNIEPERLGRGGFSEEYVYREYDGKERVYRDVRLGERVVFDTYTHWAAQDDKLYGLPNRQLKTLARHFRPERDWILGDPLYPKMRELVGTQTLRQYMDSDVEATALMFDIYYPVFRAVVDLLGNVTLKEITEGTKGFLGMHVCRTCCDKASIAFEGSNKDRWGDVAIKKQAAITNTFIPNTLFKDPIHLDFSSMYPSIIMTFNISPETTRIVGFEPLGKFSARRDLLRQVTEYVIPDEKLNKNVKIEVSERIGYLPGLYRELYDRRNEIKAEMLKYDYGTPEYVALDTEQSAIKMILNSGTGYMGEIHAKYADVAQYILIVGIGRELFKRLVSFIEHRDFGALMEEYEQVNRKRHPKFDGSLSPFRYVIEGDTDGIYLNTPVDLDRVNAFINKLVVEEMRGGENYMKLGVDQYDAIYCPNYKGKNYVLAKDGKVRFKGVAFKSSRWPPMFKEARDDLGAAKLLGDGDPVEIYRLWREYINSTDNIATFIMNMEVKDPEAYAKNCLPKTIALQARERFQMKDVAGQSFTYVKLRNGYWIVTAQDTVETLPSAIDRDYYIRIFDQAVERLGMENVTTPTKQLSLLSGWSC